MSTIDSLRKALDALNGLCEALESGAYPKAHEVQAASAMAVALRAEIERLEAAEPDWLADPIAREAFPASMIAGWKPENKDRMTLKLYTAPTTPAAIAKEQNK